MTRTQPPESKTAPDTARDAMLLLLAVAAGCVDAASYLGLGGVLTAAMTGNTILLGIAVGLGEFATAARACVALAGFMLGAMLAALLTARAPPQGRGRSVATAFAIELLLLALLALGWHLAGERATEDIAHLYPLVAAAGTAMGLQSAAVNRIGVEGISTTYVTGTLTSTAMRLVAWLLPSHRDAVPSAPRRTGRGPGLPLLVWLAYGSGAAAAAVAKRWWPEAPPVAIGGIALHWPPVALLLPIVLLFAVTVIAALRRR